MHINIYTYMFTCVYAYMFVHMRVSMNIHVCLHMHMHICVTYMIVCAKGWTHHGLSYVHIGLEDVYMRMYVCEG